MAPDPEDPAGRVSGRLVARGRRGRPLHAGEGGVSAEQASPASKVQVHVTDDLPDEPAAGWVDEPVHDDLWQEPEAPAEPEPEPWDGEDWEDEVEWVDDAAAAEGEVGPPELAAPEPVPHRVVEPDTMPDELLPRRMRRRSRRRQPVGARSVAFGLVVLLLAAAVPGLTWYGWRQIQTSRAGVTRAGTGDVLNSERLLPFTATALVVLTKPDGSPLSAAMFALTHGDVGGGSVLFLPLDTTVPKPAYGVDRLRTAYSLVGLGAFTAAAAQILRQSFGDIVTLDASGLAEHLALVGPLTVDNPAPIVVGRATIPAGLVAVSPAEAMGFLTTGGPKDNFGTGAVRQQHFWQAWFSAVARAGTSAIVGETESGIGRYLLTMSKGRVDFGGLPVTSRLAPGAFGSPPVLVFDVQDYAARVALAKAVPLPQAPNSARPAIRLLNGVDREAIPTSVVQRLVLGGGQVALLGADPGKVTTTTELRYGDRTITGAVQQIRDALGVGRLVIDDAITDPGEITVLVGRDLLDRPPADLFPSDSESSS